MHTNTRTTTTTTTLHTRTTTKTKNKKKKMMKQQLANKILNEEEKEKSQGNIYTQTLPINNNTDAETGKEIIHTPTTTTTIFYKKRATREKVEE